jgi:hypothetical protein
MTSAPKPFWQSPVWLLALLATTLAAGLHAYFISHAGGFWRDEVNLINLAQSGSLARMQQDSFPVLMPGLAWVWLKTGFSEASLRWLGLVFGLGILSVMVAGAWKIQRQPPLLGLVLLGMNSTLFIFGDSLRAYGLGCLTVMLAVYAGAFFVQRPGWKRVLLLAATSILSVQTLYHNAILVGAVCLAAMLVCARRRLWRAAGQALLAGAAAAISLLPYLPNLIAAQEGSASLRSGLKWSRLFEGVSDAFGFPVPQYLWVWAVLIFVILIQGGRSLRSKPRDMPENPSADLPLYAACAVGFSVVGYLGFLWLAAMPSQSWYLLPLMAVVVTGLDLAWPFWRPRWRLALAGGVAATLLLAVPAAWRMADYRFTNVNLWTQSMKPSVGPDDYVILVPWFCGITFGHYFEGTTAWDTLPPITDHSVHRFDLVKQQLQNTNAIAPVREKIAATLAAGHQVWILAMKGWMDVPEPGTPAAATLPSAPSTRWGWSEVPYTLVWVSQTAHQIADQSQEFKRVTNPTAAGRFIENTDLFVARGWKPATNSPVK